MRSKKKTNKCKLQKSCSQTAHRNTMNSPEKRSKGLWKNKLNLNLVLLFQVFLQQPMMLKWNGWLSKGSRIMEIAISLQVTSGSVLRALQRLLLWPTFWATLWCFKDGRTIVKVSATIKATWKSVYYHLARYKTLFLCSWSVSLNPFLHNHVPFLYDLWCY